MPLHGPVSFPHISVRSDDASRKTGYMAIHAGRAHARPPLAPSRNEAPAPPPSPRRWPGLFIAARESANSVKHLPPVRLCRETDEVVPGFAMAFRHDGLS